MIGKKQILFFLTVVILLFDFTDLSAESSFSSERLKEASYNFLKSRCKYDMEITFLSNISPITFREEGVTAKINEVLSCAGLTKVGIEFILSGKVLRKLDISLKIKVFDIAPVAVRTIQSGSKLRPEDIIMARVDITNQLSDELLTSDDIIGAEIKKTIPKGTVIVGSLLDNDKVIKRGDKVVVEVQSGAVRIRAAGYSLQDAKPGEQVKFKYEGNILTGIAARDGTIILSSNDNYSNR